MRRKIILQPSATVRADVTILYCNKHCTHLASHRVNPYGEKKNIYIYI